MKIIKFRAKRTDNHPVFWAYGYLVKTPITTEFNCDGQFLDSGGEGRYCIVTDTGVAHEVDVKTLGQFTGLKDKNGKEVYEGDIVDIHPVNPFRHSVKKRNVIQWINGGLFLKSIDDSILGHGELPSGHRIEVIGNIWENPNLLSQKEKEG